MSDEVRNILIELISRHGAELAREYKRLKGFLLDRCPEARREVSVLILAAEVGIAKELYLDNGKTSPGLIQPRLTERLYDDYGIDRKLASWVLESWAEALKKARASARPKEDLSLINRTAEPVSKHTFTINGVSFNMVRIPAGEFMMGSPSDEPGRKDDETQHLVRITQAFWLGETQVTQGLWMAVMGDNPSYFDDWGLNFPVEQVSWEDCQVFIQRLNREIQGGGFRLPTEAEWEYACRAGTTTPFYTGQCLNTDEANYRGVLPMEGCQEGEDRCSPITVASFRPNAWGIYDIHGNVWEWCQDWYDDYPHGTATDPEGPSEGASRVLRGGSWSVSAELCRSALRIYVWPDFRYINLGLRLARTHIEKHSGQLSALPVTAIPKINKPPKYTKLGYGGVELPDFATQETGWIMTRNNETGLIWELKTIDNICDKYTWRDAKSVFIARSNKERFGGFDGWRLPEKEELEVLIEEGPTPYIHAGIINNYWSASKCDFSLSCVWYVNFYYGYTNYAPMNACYCVIAVQPTIQNQTIQKSNKSLQLFTEGNSNVAN